MCRGADPCDLWSLLLRIDQKAETANSNAEQTTAMQYGVPSYVPLHRRAGIFPSFHLPPPRLAVLQTALSVIFGHRLFSFPTEYISPWSPAPPRRRAPSPGSTPGRNRGRRSGRSWSSRLTTVARFRYGTPSNDVEENGKIENGNGGTHDKDLEYVRYVRHVREDDGPSQMTGKKPSVYRSVPR